MLTIATLRYFARQKIIDSGLAPVRTTIGAPKFSLGYELAGSVGMLAPYGLFSIEDPAEIEAAYASTDSVSRRSAPPSRTSLARPVHGG
jgi:hypothetical protein